MDLSFVSQFDKVSVRTCSENEFFGVLAGGFAADDKR